MEPHELFTPNGEKIIPPKAMEWDELWADMEAKYGTDQWSETTEAMYQHQLGAVPPELYIRGGFLVGEAANHTRSGEPIFAAFRRKDTGDGYEAKYMTIRQGIAFNNS
jgi:hypothetical protein